MIVPGTTAHAEWLLPLPGGIPSHHYFREVPTQRKRMEFLSYNNPVLPLSH